MFEKISTPKNRIRTPVADKNIHTLVGNQIHSTRNNTLKKQKEIQSSSQHNQRDTVNHPLVTYMNEKKSQLMIQQSFINFIRQRTNNNSIYNQQEKQSGKSKSTRPATVKVRNKRQLLKFIMKKPFFNQTSSKLVEELLEKIEYLQVHQNQYIYKIGDDANNIYILMDGKIDLMINEFQEDDIVPTQKDELEQLILSRKFTYDEQSSISIKLANNLSDKRSLNRKQNLERSSLMKLKTMKSILKWQTFGQFQIGVDQKRSMSALAKKYSQLLVIRRQQYQLVMRACQTTSTQEKFAFINSITLFRKMFRPSLQALIYHLDPISLSYGQKLYLEGSKVERVYILADGQLLLTKKVLINLTQCNEASKFEKSKEETYKSLKLDLPYEKILPYVKLEKGQVLNDAELILKSQYHLDSCIVNSQQATLYVLEQNLFIERILSAQNQVASIKEYCQKKLERKKSTIENFKINHFQNELFVKFLTKKSTRISGTERRKMITKNCKSMNLNRQEQQSKIGTSQEQVKNRKVHSSIAKYNQHNSIPPSFNFFKQFNSTFKKNSLKANNKKISRIYSEPKANDQSSKQDQQNQQKSRRSVPAAIQDIVQIVSFKQRYEKIRQFSQSKHSFQIDLNNVPLHVQKKYQFFFKMRKNKQKECKVK